MRQAATRSSSITALLAACVAFAHACFYSFDMPPGACDPNHPCPGGQLCAYPDLQCGRGELGTCTDSLEACEKARVHPVCACDGKAALFACDAYGRGFDLAVTGPCEGAIGSRCGPYLCNPSGFACWITRPGGHTEYECRSCDGPCSCGGLPPSPQCTCTAPAGEAVVIDCMQ